jgi:hypothetical protein
MKKQTLLTFLLLAFKAVRGANPVQYHRSMMDLARLKASLMYVKGIETFRLLFMSAMGMGVCLVLLLSSLMLFHAALFLYTPWSAQVKLMVGLSFALVYFLITVKAFSYVLSESKWLEIFHAQDVAEDIAGKVSPQSSTEDYSKNTKKRSYEESHMHN